MTSEASLEARLLVQVPRGGAAERNLRADVPPSVASGRIVVEPVEPRADGTLGPPQAGEIVMSVLSPEALRQEQEEVRDVVRGAGEGDEPLVIIIEAAEYLREDELAVVVDAASHAPRPVIVRVAADA
jgi:hypothetical protein